MWQTLRKEEWAKPKNYWIKNYEIWTFKKVIGFFFFAKTEFHIFPQIQAFCNNRKLLAVSKISALLLCRAHLGKHQHWQKPQCFVGAGRAVLGKQEAQRGSPMPVKAEGAHDPGPCESSLGLANTLEGFPCMAQALCVLPSALWDSGFRSLLLYFLHTCHKAMGPRITES